MKTDKQEILKNVREKFCAVEIRTLDSKNRINLGEKIIKKVSQTVKPEAYKVFIGDDGDILLRPVVTVSSREAWIYRNPKVLKQIRQGLQEAAEGKLEKIKDLEGFLEDL